MVLFSAFEKIKYRQKRRGSPMVRNEYPVIDTVATGDNIRRLREKRGLTVKDLQSYFGFEMPQAIYKWQRGESLPSVDNLYALGRLLDVPLDEIIIQTRPLHIRKERQPEGCRSDRFLELPPDADGVRTGPFLLCRNRRCYACLHRYLLGAALLCRI